MDKEQKSPKTIRPLKLVYLLLIFGIVSIVFAGIMGTRLFNKIDHLPPPSPRETDISRIEGWMTIPYISKAYHIPERLLLEKMNLDPHTNRRKSLNSLAETQGKPADVFLNELQLVITQFQSADPTFSSP